MPGYFIIGDNSPVLLLNSCVRVVDDSSCLRYDIGNTFADSTFECRDGCVDARAYYIDKNGRCTERQNKDDFCEEFNSYSDTCLLCYPSYLVFGNSTCMSVFEEIYGCLEYVSEHDCARCVNNFYVDSSGRCTPVAALIDNCADYDHEKSCNRCMTGFYLTGNMCQKTYARNCLIAAGPLNCKICHKGWGFIQEGLLINCAEIALSDCEITNDRAPFKCIKCLKGFYPNIKGECQELTGSISMCSDYADENTCESCEGGSALSADGQTCVNEINVKLQIDRNCANSLILSMPQCVACDLGFYLRNGKCELCDNLRFNCQVCDPFFPTECFICKSGYFQDVSGDCLEPAKGEEDTQEGLIVQNNRTLVGVEYLRAEILGWFFVGLSLLVWN